MKAEAAQDHLVMKIKFAFLDTRLFPSSFGGQLWNILYIVCVRGNYFFLTHIVGTTWNLQNESSSASVYNDVW